MTQLFSIFSRIPGAAKILVPLILVLGLFYYLWRAFGLVPALVMLGGVALIWVAVVIFQRWQKRKERQKGLEFGKALDEQAGPGKAEVREAVSDLNKKWREAMENLKGSRIDIYQLPWYMLIGEPQSGKSTTLKFSGLRFPVGEDAISGGGGTRNCDWWFAEKGVILDTAGRFTFHDESRPDSAEWDRFLDLLARHRPYCPINGIILVIPIDALLGISQDEMGKRARNISTQLRHIQQHLAIQFPVYLMVTKCDRIHGFMQFFNKLPADQQREMLGWSSDNEEAAFDSGAFGQSFDQLSARLDALRLNYFSDPTYIDDPGKTYTFPDEFRDLREPLRRYLEIIFQDSVYKDPLFFRGYYFCSGMQEGQPIVSACRKMLPNTGGLKRLEEIFTRSRAFFVRDFYSEKVFPEEGLVRRASHYQRADKMKQKIVWAGNIAMLLIGALFVWGMHRDLKTTLTRPMTAIDNTVTALDTTKGTFFDTTEDRRVIYTRLSELRRELDTEDSGGFFAMFRGDRNAMTEPLDKTFANLFLDRFLLGLFHETQQQLRNYQLKAPPEPRNSADELKTLTAALTELKRWQVAVNQNKTDDFDPSITPFLALTLDPVWDDELAELRQDRPLATDLNAWFIKAYDRSPDATKKFLIEEMVRRATGIYDNLHQSVVNFYNNQPELAAYRNKDDLLAQLEQAYRAVGQSSPTWQGHDEKMVTLAGYFSPEKRAEISAGDNYLSFDQVRNQTIDALGPEFTDMRLTAEEKASLLNPIRNADQERRKLEAAITFVNQLQKRDLSQLPDPRADRPPEEEDEALGYPARIEDFWTRILDDYMNKFRGVENPYTSLPEAGKNLEENLGSLFQIGRDRMAMMKRLLQDNMPEHVDQFEDKDVGKRFENSFNDFYDNLVTHEQEQIGEALGRILTGESLGVPRPPRGWNQYVSAFKSRSKSGRDYGGFTEGPGRVLKLLDDNHQREIRAIFSNTAKPTEAISEYVDKANGNLADFYDALLALDGIPDRELANNKTKYTNQIPGKRKLQALADIRNVPPYLVAHRVSLKAWADGALDAFRVRVRGSDPCPECPGQLQTLRQAVVEAGNGFPMHFSGFPEPISEELGVTRFDVNLTQEERLDKVLAALNTYRSLTPLQKDYLSDAQEQLIADAIAWADGVRLLKEGSITYRFMIKEAPGNTNNITERAITHAKLQGAWEGERWIVIISARMTALQRNAEAEGTEMALFFYNEDRLNNTEALLRFPGGLQAFLAYAVSGKRLQPTRIERPVLVRLNVGNREAAAILILETSAPLPPPPDWTILTGN